MNQPARIRVMPKELALKIAAGEVVERPASAVKELLDNAIDADATVVSIEVREAGLKLIRITDNGCGITEEDLPLAFAPHATSKITEAEDLTRLGTLGFRGEALASIGAISRVEVQSCLPDANGNGRQLEILFGKVTREAPCAGVPGLRVSVWDLFSNVPARRSFVRSFRAEAGQIQQVVSQYALAHPALRLSLVIDERLAFESPGSGDLRHAFAAVYGPAALDSMIWLEAEEQGLRAWGLISDPTFSRQNRTGLHFFVNGRPIQNRSLGYALTESYRGLLMSGRFPLAAIHLSVPPNELDVNIHPSKLELRFAREREVNGLVHRAAERVLMDRRSEPPSVGINDLPYFQPSNSPEPLVDMVENTTDAGPPGLLPKVPILRVFGQTNQTFIIAEGPNGIYMIDQHAAHERLLFDQLDEQIASGESLSQPLIEPVTEELGPDQMESLEANRELLEELGFRIEPFGDSACLIRAIPAVTPKEAPGTLVQDVLTDLQTLSTSTSAKERVLSAVACKAAVKAGQTLDLSEMREIVTRLESTARPATCPHGRPTMVHLSHLQLERQFGRR